MIIELFRTMHQDKQTLGRFNVIVGGKVKLTGVTMELPWRDNRTNVSCIPTGRYKLSLFTSAKFGKCLEVMNVPGRNAILIHKGNYNKDTHGCILPGRELFDLNKDGLFDVVESGVTVEKVLSCWDGAGEIIIENEKAKE